MSKRSYFEEINEISGTWDAITSRTMRITEGFRPEFLAGTAYCVGSGGSLPLAKLWEYLHESLGLGYAKTLTPYEFNNTKKASDLVVLFSARGKHHDILQVFKTSIQKRKRLLVFTVTPDSALMRLVKSNPESAHAVYPTIKIPQDGFLAVNSTIAMLGLTMHFKNKIFAHECPNISPVQQAIDHHTCNSIKWRCASHDTLQIIASDYGVPAGIDLEARLAESGVAASFLTDPRNFGHGRFIWLDQHPGETKVVLISTLRSRNLMKRVEKHIPENIERYRINAPYNGLWGSIYCITSTMLLLGDLAKKRKLDPGKPEVPDWGRKIHTLRLGKKDLPDGEIQYSADSSKYPALTMQFNAIVMDIDGTLIDTKERLKPMRKEVSKEINRLLELGLRFGISTGRGDSALSLLQEQVSREFWDRITMGLYNGTLVMKLSADFERPSEMAWPTGKIIDTLLEPICNQYKVKKTSRPTQITIYNLTAVQRDEIYKNLIDQLGQRIKFVKTLTTGHSLDISPSWSTKLSVVEAISNNIDDVILCIGDQGQIGGNDEELLVWKPSVSVGKDRPASNSCLWLGKEKSLRESSGALVLLKAIEANKNHFIINSERLVQLLSEHNQGVKES